jgi:hypothetical protein
MAWPTALVQPRLRLPLVVNIADLRLSLALKRLLVFAVQPGEKRGHSIPFVAFSGQYARIIDPAANLEPPPLVTPWGKLLATYAGPPWTWYALPLGSLHHIAALLPIVHPSIGLAAMFLHLADVPNAIWACLAPQSVVNRQLDVGDGSAVRRRQCLTLQPGLILSDVRHGLNHLMDYADLLTAGITYR